MLPGFSQIITEILTTITLLLDFIAVTIIAVSIFQVLMFKVFTRHAYYFPFLYYKNGPSQTKNERVSKRNGLKRNVSLKVLVSGLLLALEFESASAIIKLGIFTTSITAPSSESLSSNFDNFIFFCSILTLRIMLNQSLKRFNISG